LSSRRRPFSSPELWGNPPAPRHPGAPCHGSVAHPASRRPLRRRTSTRHHPRPGAGSSDGAPSSWTPPARSPPGPARSRQRPSPLPTMEPAGPRLPLPTARRRLPGLGRSSAGYRHVPVTGPAPPGREGKNQAPQPARAQITRDHPGHEGQPDTSATTAQPTASGQVTADTATPANQPGISPRAPCSLNIMRRP
jgi:hypothetical protein